MQKASKLLMKAFKGTQYKNMSDAEFKKSFSETKIGNTIQKQST